MVKVAELLAAGRTFSFEFFPPKSDAEQATLVKALYELQALTPSFVSVTYRGGRSSRERTHDLVAGMLKTTSLTPMAHLICVAHTRLELAEILVGFRKAGVENLMALGGDPPTDVGATEGELRHAIELVELARAIGGFSVGVAAHPVGHPRSPDLGTDRDHLCAKLSLADFAITQFFFELGDYLSLVEQCGARGMAKPIVPGIMPVTTLASIPHMAQMGAAVPPSLVARLEGAADHAAESGRDDAVRHEGIEAATELCEKLLAEGAPGLHFYTLNRSLATRQIYASLGLPRT
ncbi:MAG TPA: methylenetetrahydrofolate reductase [Acidimicrobiales bacterium]|jgi:methylenetetrahydrofolate reductase (NADPH)|nr:methylenetetrahydrofolate reductase [Acidimicrobiales bacterium]